MEITIIGTGNMAVQNGLGTGFASAVKVLG
jgi:hypothetical protein